jgi:hypothetical protein
MNRCAWAIVCGVCLAAGTPAFAQAPYVSVSLGADVQQLSHVEGGVSSRAVPDGATLSWALRVGTSIEDRWGVELEHVRAAETEKEIDYTPGVSWLDFDVLTSGTSLPTVPAIPRTVFSQRATTRRQQASIAPLAWIRTEISDAIGVVFLGGVAFNRTRSETDFTIDVPPNLLPFITVPADSTTVLFSTSAIAGVEARVRLTEHVRLVPGVRIQGVSGGWIVRPAVGLGWQF